jgi:hypothetical protein
MHAVFTGEIRCSWVAGTSPAMTVLVMGEDEG